MFRCPGLPGFPYHRLFPVFHPEETCGCKSAVAKESSRDNMGIDGQPKIWPVILSGGSGTRLWPKSRTLFPKQFHVLTSEHSLLQEALLRVKDDSMYANPMVICNEEHRFIVAEQAEELNIELQDIVLEPEGRNTAPAVAVATALVRSMDPTGLVLVLAADHHIPKVDQFTAAVALGRVAASKYICTFGVTPTSPETGYGYIKRLLQEVSPGVFKIDQFKEKPDLATAKKYVADPKYAWNAGMLLISNPNPSLTLARQFRSNPNPNPNPSPSPNPNPGQACSSSPRS